MVLSIIYILNSAQGKQNQIQISSLVICTTATEYFSTRFWYLSLNDDDALKMYDFVTYYSDEVWIQAASSILLQEL